MERSGEFIRLYNEMVEHMRRVTGADRNINFPQLVAMASRRDPVIKKYGLHLREYGNLRNSIVHHSGFPEEIMAVPSEATIERFREIVANITAPKTLIPAYKKDIRCFNPDDKLVEALRHMHDHDFAQVVVRRDEQLCLLTVRGIGRWIASHSEKETIDVHGVTIRDVMNFEMGDTCTVMKASNNVNEAQQAFTDSLVRKRRRLFAIIITQNGRHDEQPVGLVTPVDLLDIDGA